MLDITPIKVGTIEKIGESVLSLRLFNCFTHFASKTKAIIPAAIGAAAEVPV